MSGYKTGYFIGRFIKILTISILVLIVIFLAGFYINTSRVIPDNVQLYIDPVNQTFITPPCVNPDQIDELKKLEHFPKNNVPEKYKSYKSAGDCTWQSLQANSNLTKDIFGFGKDPMSRWNEKGEWQW